jgi:transcriptional regulator with XRE-family HTH domain
VIDYETFARIRDCRDRQGLTITQIARALGLLVTQKPGRQSHDHFGFRLVRMAKSPSNPRPHHK